MKRFAWLALFCAAFLPFVASAAEVKEVVSPGGFKAWLVEEPALPLVAVKIVFKGSGAAYDPKGREGLAGLTAAMLMEGAGELDSKSFNEALENHAIRLNFGIEEDMFHASVESLSEYREQAFSYLALALTKPRFDGEALTRVRGQSLSMLRQQETRPGYVLSRAWENTVFAGHPYSNPALGTPASLEAITRDDLADFAGRSLTRENILIAVVGDITAPELAALMDTHLSGLPAQYRPAVAVPDVRLPETATQIVADLDVPQTMVAFGTNGLKRGDPDYYAGYVLNHMLGGGGLSSKLAVEIRQKRGLAYSVSSNLDPMAHAAQWRGGFATRNAEIEAALDALRGALAEFAKNGPSEKDMKDAIEYLTGSFVLNLDSNAEIASYLISMQLHHLGRDYLDKRNGFIRAVTREQVRRLAATLADPGKLIVVMAGRPELKAEK